MLADVFVRSRPSRRKKIIRSEYTPDNVGRRSNLGSADGRARVKHHHGKSHALRCTDVLRFDAAKAEIRARAEGGHFKQLQRRAYHGSRGARINSRADTAGVGNRVS